jgi:hypothetical protein
MKTATGDIFKSKLTGELFRVKNIKMPQILLVAKNLPNKVWIGDKEMLEIFYEKVENQEA